MTKSKTIKIELDQTVARLDELNELRDTITAKLKTLQDGFVSGKTSLDKVQAEQGKLTILKDSITALDVRKTELKQAFQQASLEESRQSKLENLVSIANQSEPLFDEYLKAREEFHEIVSEHARILVEKMGAYRANQNQFTAILKQVEPDLTDTSLPASEHRAIYTRVSNELEPLGLDANAFRFVTQDTFSLPEQPFDFAVTAAESILVNEIENEKRALEKAEFNKRRAERWEKSQQQIAA